jgi:DNA-binding NarL/FixJ family response regulator
MRRFAERRETSSSLPRAVLADDHLMVMEGIAKLLAERIQLVAVAATGRALVDAIGRTPPDLAITDVNMPQGSGIDAMKSVRTAGGRTPFLFLTMHAEGPLVASVMRAGASGYVLKSAAGEELLKAVDGVLGGGTDVTPSLGAKMLGGFSVQRYRLTPKQEQILRLTGRGLRSKQIAARLGLSTRTVEAHRYTLMQIFEVHSVLELVQRATHLGCFMACTSNELETT